MSHNHDISYIITTHIFPVFYKCIFRFCNTQCHSILSILFNSFLVLHHSLFFKFFRIKYKTHDLIQIFNFVTIHI